MAEDAPGEPTPDDLHALYVWRTLDGPRPPVDCLARLIQSSFEHRVLPDGTPDVAPEPHIAKAQAEYLREYARIVQQKRQASTAPAALAKPSVLRLLWRIARRVRS